MSYRQDNEAAHAGARRKHLSDAVSQVPPRKSWRHEPRGRLHLLISLPLGFSQAKSKRWYIIAFSVPQAQCSRRDTCCFHLKTPP